MKKTILSTLLILCLLVGLLPITAMAANGTASVTLGNHTLQISAYDKAAYSVNTTAEVLDTADNKFNITMQTSTGASEDNWNAKLIWKSGDAAPTLYIKGFKVDDYNSASTKWRARYQSEADRNDPKKKDSAALTTGITIPKNQPTTIVITGEDSLIQCRFGITYNSALTVKSEGDAKLTMNNLSSGISSVDTSGQPLTLNANLDITVQSYYNSAHSYMIQTNKADLTIEGGNIKVDTPTNNFILGITTRNSGDIHIKGGKITATSSVGVAPTNGTIHANGQIIIDGGELDVTAKFAVPLYATKGITINGGKVNVLSPYYCINAGNADNPADIAINGGTVIVTGQNAFFKAPKLGPNVTAFAGASEESAEPYDGSDTKLSQKPWMIISSEKIEIATTEAPTQPILIVTTPTTEPTQPTTAPTQATIATNGQNNASDSNAGNNSILLVAIAAVVVIAGAAVVVIITKRRKAA